MSGSQIAAQQNGNPIPGATPALQTPTSSAEGDASISGVVLDTSGAAVPEAKISLTSVDGSRRRTLTSGTNGEFTFNKMASGSYLVIVEATGLEAFTSAEFVPSATGL